MFATKTSTLIRRSAPRLAKSALASKSAFPAVTAGVDSFFAATESPSYLTAKPTIRHFATLQAQEARAVGSVTKTLRVLDMEVVKKILDELRSVDVNSDGRYV